MSDVKQFCDALDDWAERMEKSEKNIVGKYAQEFGQAWRTVRLAIEKSCLLNRVLYCGEKPSKTPCPVHEGCWSGIHIGWPGQQWADGSMVGESSMLREWYDQGCRCYLHNCGCTTGWQPDEHCGCGRKS